MKFFFVCLFFACTLCSCSINQRGEIIVLSSSAIDSAQKVEVIESIALPSSDVRKTSVSVLADTLLLIENDDALLSHNDEMYYLYSPNIGNRYPLLLFSNSDSGLLSSTTCRNGDIFVVHDFIKSNVYAYDVNNILNGDRTPYIKHINFSTQYLLPYQDTSFIFLNPYCFAAEPRTWNNSKKRFCVSSGGSYKFNSSYKFDPYDVTRGVFIMDSTHNRIVYFDAHLNRIEFYDYYQRPIRTLLGPGYDNIKYGSVDFQEQVKGIVFIGSIPETYLEVTYNEDYIFAAYSGGTIQPDNNRVVFKSFVFMFSWDGELLNSYQCDLHIKTLSSSLENNRVVYIFGQDTPSHYSLLKCSL